MRVTRAAATRTCAVCERTLLMGERAVRFTPDGHDFVIVARPEMASVASERGAAGVEEELRGVLASAGVEGKGK